MVPGEKSRLILTELRRRLELYQRHRKVRAPTIMEGRAGLRPVPSIVEKRLGSNPPPLLPGGYMLGGAMPPADATRSGSMSSVAAMTSPTMSAPASDVQFGTASMGEYKTPPMASAALDTHIMGFMGPPVYGNAGPAMAFGTAPSPQYPTPGGASDSSGVGSVGTMAAGATMNMDLTGLAEAATGGQVPGLGNVGSRPQAMDMDIDWVSVCRAEVSSTHVNRLCRMRLIDYSRHPNGRAAIFLCRTWDWTLGNTLLVLEEWETSNEIRWYVRDAYRDGCNEIWEPNMHILEQGPGWQIGSVSRPLGDLLEKVGPKTQLWNFIIYISCRDLPCP